MVGGSVSVYDEIVISTELMNKIESVDENSGIVRNLGISEDLNEICAMVNEIEDDIVVLKNVI